MSIAQKQKEFVFFQIDLDNPVDRTVAEIATRFGNSIKLHLETCQQQLIEDSVGNCGRVDEGVIPRVIDELSRVIDQCVFLNQLHGSADEKLDQLVETFLV